MLKYVVDMQYEKKKPLSGTSNLSLKKENKNYFKFFGVLHVAVKMTSRRIVSKEMNLNIAWHETNMLNEQE